MFFLAVAALFAVYMLARHVPRAAAALRTGRRADLATVVSLLTVVFALAVLVVSVKGLARGLINR